MPPPSLAAPPMFIGTFSFFITTWNLKGKRENLFCFITYVGYSQEEKAPVGILVFISV